MLLPPPLERIEAAGGLLKLHERIEAAGGLLKLHERIEAARSLLQLHAAGLPPPLSVLLPVQ